MRRADRLFQIVQTIRGRRLTTAAHLAQRLEVSERTVYRDVADLQAQGVPVTLNVRERHFADGPGKTLADLLRSVQKQPGGGL
jgi:predicted DNA-binding transcriptional regulator YafY